MKKEYQILIENFLADSCTEAQLMKIQELLDDADFALELREAQRLQGLCASAAEGEIDLWSGLRDEIEEFEPDDFEQEVMKKLESIPKPSTKRRRSFKWPFLAAAALHLILIGVAIVYFTGQIAEPMAIAFIDSQGNDSFLIRGDKTFSISSIKKLYPDDRIEVGDEGLVTLTYSDGSHVRLSARTSAQLLVTEGRKEILLNNGRLYGDIRPQAQQMTITTKNAAIAIVGTQFNIDAYETSTVLEVLEGKVKFTDRASGKSQLVKTQEIASVDQQFPGIYLEPISRPNFISPLVTWENRGTPTEIIVDISKAKKLYLVVSNELYGCAAAWNNPRLEGPAGSISLTQLEWEFADTTWREVTINKVPWGGPVLHNKKIQSNAICTHAISLIIYTIPAGYKSFKSQAFIPDFNKASDGLPAMKFKVYTQMSARRLQQLKQLIKKSKLKN